MSLIVIPQSIEDQVVHELREHARQIVGDDMTFEERLAEELVSRIVSEVLPNHPELLNMKPTFQVAFDWSTGNLNVAVEWKERNNALVGSNQDH